MGEADAKISGAMQGIAAESGKSFGAVKGAGKDEDGGMNDLYKINQIYFRMLPTLSLVAKRTLLVNQAQKTSYVGDSDTIVYVFNTGEFFTSMRSSYLYIKVGYNNPASYGNAKALLSQGNVLQLFEEVTFTTASGTEVCRELNKGLNASFMLRYENTQEYLDTNGGVQGAPMGNYSLLHDGTAPTPGNYVAGGGASLEAMFPSLGGRDGILMPVSGSASRGTWGRGCYNLNVHSTGCVLATGLPAPAAVALQTLEFCVPLDQVLGLFKPYLGTLFPAGALSGARLEIRIKKMQEALQFTDCTVSTTAADADPGVGSPGLNALVTDSSNTIRIDKTYIVLDAFQLQDNVLKRLNQIAAGADGLTVLFNTYDYVVTPFPGVGSVECQVQQARSRIINSICIVRDTRQITNPYVNSLSAEASIQRVCGKIGPGSGPATAYTPLPIALINTEGLGGGLTYTMLLRGGAAALNTLPSLMDSSTGVSAFGPLQLQGALPADPFGGAASWGAPIVTSYQAQLGALFFPQQPLRNAVEYYENALYIFGKGIPDCENTCSVTLEDFYGGIGNFLALPAPVGAVPAGSLVNPSWKYAQQAFVAPYGLAIYGMLAEKSQALQLSGLPISNARLLRHMFTFGQPSLSGNRQIACFTKFTRLMKVFLGGRVVVRE